MHTAMLMIVPEAPLPPCVEFRLDLEVVDHGPENLRLRGAQAPEQIARVLERGALPAADYQHLAGQRGDCEPVRVTADGRGVQDHEIEALAPVLQQLCKSPIRQEFQWIGRDYPRRQQRQLRKTIDQ